MLMLQCWRADPKERPSFSDLVITIESILTTMSDYLDITNFVLVADSSGEEKTGDTEKQELVSNN